MVVGTEDGGFDIAGELVIVYAEGEAGVVGEFHVLGEASVETKVCFGVLVAGFDAESRDAAVDGGLCCKGAC